MASEPTKYVGKIDCPICGEDLHVRQNGRDTLNVSCICCGVSSYAKGGTAAHETITGWLRDKTPGAASKEDAPAAVPAKQASTSTAPAHSIAESIKRGFSLGAL